MEGKEENNISSGVAVKGDEAPDSFRVAPRTENPSPFPGPAVTSAAAEAPPTPVSMSAQGPVSVTGTGTGTPTGTGTGTGTAPGPGTRTSTGTGAEMKKKRGRPRKYGPDGTVTMALSPMPISSSIPLTGEYSAWKRGRGKPLDSIKKSYKLEHENPGDKIAYFVGANFTPHVLTVNTGEDVTMKVMSFSQQGARAICILSANGTISNVTLRQPTSSGGTLTYEGRFEILSLSGSFMPTDNGGTKSRSGGMSVSLAGPDGRVVGGGLAGFLIAAGPVQVVVGSFLPGHQQEQKHKKQRTELPPVVTPLTVSVISAEEVKGGYSSVKPVVTTSPSFHGDNSASLNPMQGLRNLATDNKTSSADEDSKGPSQSNCEVSC